MMEVILVVGVGEGVRVGFAIVGWFDLVLLVGVGTVMMINMIGLRGGYANVGYSSEREELLGEGEGERARERLQLQLQLQLQHKRRATEVKFTWSLYLCYLWGPKPWAWGRAQPR